MPTKLSQLGTVTWQENISSSRCGNPCCYHSTTIPNSPLYLAIQTLFWKDGSSSLLVRQQINVFIVRIRSLSRHFLQVGFLDGVKGSVTHLIARFPCKESSSCCNSMKTCVTPHLSMFTWSIPAKLIYIPNTNVYKPVLQFFNLIEQKFMDIKLCA